MVARFGETRIEAYRGLTHGLDYRCPGCSKPVVLHARVGGWVVPHFKHKADIGCANGRGESPAHRAVKALLRDHFRGKGHSVEVEHWLDGRRADIYLPDLRSACEVEFSNKETREFVAKCRDYIKCDVKSLWILHHRQVQPRKVRVGATTIISVSPVLRLIESKHRPKGARAAFFAYDGREAVVFRGTLGSYMLYKEYDDYTGNGGYPYASRRWMELTINDVIRREVPAPQFPTEPGRRAPPQPCRTEALAGTEAEAA